MLVSLEWDSLALRRKEHRLNVLQNAIHVHISIPVRNILRPTTRLSRSANSITFYKLQVRKDRYKGPLTVSKKISQCTVEGTS